MKMKTLALASIAAFGLVSAAAQADTPTTPVATTVNGGTVHFKGEVVNAACAVDAGSADQTVQLGQIQSSTLQGAGSSSSAVGFNIKLAGCDLTNGTTKASILWAGDQGDDNTTLALQGSTAGGAKNVGIQILDSTGKPVTINGTTATVTTLVTGTNVLPFQARYYSSKGGAQAGSANADATFKVQYQ